MIMPDSSIMFDNPIVMTVSLGLLIGLAGAMVGRFVPLIARLTPAAAFLGSYYFAYGIIPDFPPIASTGKVFYAVVALAVLGVVFDYVWRSRPVPVICAIALPALLFLWIGYSRLTTAFSTGLAIIALCYVVGGALAIWQIHRIDSAPASASRGPVSSISMLLALAAGYAPIALVGGSSTGLGLLAGFAGGMAVLGLVQFAAPLTALGWTGILSGFGGLLALNDSVTLINGKLDFLLLVPLCLCLVFGQLGGLLLPRMDAKSVRLGQFFTGISTLIPSFVVIGLAYLRHADAFHP
jgi:hypothetical protein